MTGAISAQGGVLTMSDGDELVSLVQKVRARHSTP